MCDLHYRPSPINTNLHNSPSSPIAAPNKSTLFQSIVTQIQTETSSNQNNSTNSSTKNLVPQNSVTSRPVNHGKPNCAPKPPGISQIIAAKNNKPTVTRHQSMKTPR